MTPRLFLRFAGAVSGDSGDADSGNSGAVDWLIAGGKAAADAGQEGAAPQGRVEAGDLAALLEHAPWAGGSPERVVVFVPTSEVVAISAEVPGRNAAHVRQAAPYAVEEFITEDIDTMHVACGPLARGEPVRCLIVRRAVMRGWLDCLAAAGIAPGCMTAEAMAVPVEEGGVGVLFDGDSALVRTAEQIASVDVPILPAVLAALHDELGGGTPPLRQINGALSDVDLRASGFAAADTETDDEQRSLLGHLAAHFDSASPIDLLQGDFAVRRRAGTAWSQWRSVAAALAAWGAIGVVALGAQGFWANQRADGYRSEAVALYKELYGVQRVAGNPAARMRRELGQAPTASIGFRELLANFGVALDSAAGRYELRGISYTDRSGFGADVVVSDLDSLEQLQSVLAGRGLRMEMISAEQQSDDRVRANLRIGDASGPGGEPESRG